jgi:hypothetical protein
MVSEMRCLVLFLLLLSLPAVAQKIYVYPAAVTAPRGSYQTVTAIVTGVNDKTVTWTSDGGTIVGTNPCVVNEPCTVALTTTTPGAYHLTAKSNSNNSVSATSTITFTGSPTPVTTHPRLVITAAMVPGLRAKATARNPMYTSIRERADTALTADKAIWSWSCRSGTGLPSSNQVASYKEQHAYLFAFMSLADPSPANRAAWGCYSRDIMVYMMNAVLSNSASPIDGPYGLTGNRGSDSTLQFTLTVDWLMGGGYLSDEDQTTARKYFAFVGQNMVSTTFTGSRAVVGHYSSAAQFLTGSIFDYTGQRAMGNNYTHSKEMYLAAAALTFNDTAADDPPTPNTCGATRYVVCPDGTAGSLHAYWTYLSGGMLYKDWAHIEDPNVSWQAYQAAYSNLPTVPSCNNPWSSRPVPCFGDGRGGESSEGSWYRYSLYRSRYALNAIHTAGYDDPILYGPQMSYGTSSWWDLHYIAELGFLTGKFGRGVSPWESGTACDSSCMAYLTTGDSLAYYRMPSDFDELASTMVFDTYSGRTDRANALEWPILNVAFGGPSGFLAGLANDYASAVALDLFIALPAADPTTTRPPTDPRPAFPADVFDAGNQHILARSGWSPNDTTFSYYCPNSGIDHEHEFCGRFDIFSKGEYITKGRTEFNNYNDLMSTAPQSNLAGYMQPSSSSCPNNSCYMYDPYSGGGQFFHSYQAGEVTLLHNESPAYVAAIVDTTNLYNASSTGGFGYYNGVIAASRSLIYLRGTNQVVYYDRGVTGSAQDHAIWQVATGPLTINGNTASWPTRSGNQKVYFTSLISSGGTVADAGAYTGETYPQSSDWEPYTRVVVDAGAQASTQFLSVMEWGSSSLAQTATSLVYSSSGANFDGALVGTSLVMFMRNWPQTFTGVTYPASKATTQYVSDLIPNTSYSITGDGTPGSATTDAAGVLTFRATGTGSITVKANVSVKALPTNPKVSSLSKKMTIGGVAVACIGVAAWKLCSAKGAA